MTAQEMLQKLVNAYNAYSLMIETYGAVQNITSNKEEVMMRNYDALDELTMFIADIERETGAIVELNITRDTFELDGKPHEFEYLKYEMKAPPKMSFTADTPDK